MRLVWIGDQGDLSLVEYFTSIPRYAILSHTWGQDEEEVTLKDLLDGSGRSKTGFRKIEFCASQAASDNLRYFWVDTCCIDKSNSVELQEAINSMFRWYKNAEKCYVYLTDVSLTESIDVSLTRSRWFTRGWTLQELLAPSSLVFFSREGNRIGDRSSLINQVSSITGVSISALQGQPLSNFTMEERFSWAKKRKTKRPEDMVYSLLGIFDVYMPLIYGEGEDNARRRLQREIMIQHVQPIHAFTHHQQSSKRYHVTAISRKAGIIDLFVCGPDGQVYTLGWVNGQWSKSWTGINGDFPPGCKVTATSNKPDRLDIFACDIGGRVMVSWWCAPNLFQQVYQYRRWAAWETVGKGYFGGTEVMALYRTTNILHLFAQTEDLSMRTIEWTNHGGWSEAPQNWIYSTNRFPYPIGAHISIVMLEDTRWVVCYRTQDGTLLSSLARPFAGWADHKRLGQGFSLKASVTAIVTNSEPLDSEYDVFCIAEDGTVATNRHNRDMIPKGSWKRIFLPAGIKAQHKITAVKMSTKDWRLFVHGSDGLIYTSWSEKEEQEQQNLWAPWQALPGRTFSSSADLTATIRPDANVVDLFVSDNANARFTLSWTRVNKRNWEEWRSLPVPDIFQT